MHSLSIRTAILYVASSRLFTATDFGLFLPLHHQLHLKLGLEVVQYQQVATAVNKELAAPPAKCRRGNGNYTTYTPQQRARIGMYALKMVMRESESIFFLNSLIYRRALYDTSRRLTVRSYARKKEM